MGFWKKVLGGAVLGVGAVAAAPFTGGGSLVGAATLASSLAGAGAVAAGAGAAGAAAGVAKDNWDEKKKKQQRDNDRRAGAADEKARSALEMERLKEELIKELNAGVVNRENFFITAFAVGICAANADGVICESEKEELEFVVAGISQTDKFSNGAKQKINEMYDNPPNLESVWELINSYGFNDQKHTALFTQIVEMVIEADDDVNTDESQFISAWHYKKIA